MDHAREPSLEALLAAWLRRPVLTSAAIVLLTFWAYAPALQNGYIWDDPDYISDNVPLRSLAGLGRIWADVHSTPQYYPLVHSSFWLEYQLWGLKPFHFHFFNLLLHALGAVCLYRCLRVLALPGAFVAACVFALHPVQVESVAWVTERKNVLCGVFYFAAAACLLPVLLGGGAGEDTTTSTGGSTTSSTSTSAGLYLRYVAGLGLFVMALLSKTVACVLGPVLLVIVWWKRGRLGWRDFAWSAPLFALGAAGGLLTAWLEREHVGAKGSEWSLGFPERCIVAGRALVFYLQSLLWPGERVFMPARWHIDAGDAVQWLYPAGIVLLFALFWCARARLGPGPLAAALIFVGTLFPALGFFDVYPMRYAFAFDHFQYLATAAPIALCAAAGADWLARVTPRAHVAALLPCVLLFASYGALSWRQSLIYFDAETLWRHNLRVSPDQWLGYRQLGGIVLAQGKSDEAIALFSRAAELKPNDEAAYNNLAIAYSQRGEHAHAVEALRQSARLRPDFAPTYRNLSIALSLAGREADARAMLQRYQRMTANAK